MLCSVTRMHGFEKLLGFQLRRLNKGVWNYVGPAISG